jgi:phosphatidylglycerophosphatase A
VFKAIASVLGIGYLKGGGTIAAAACCLALYLAPNQTLTTDPTLAGLLTVGMLGLGTWVAHRVEPAWGKDSYRVVIDEVAGVWVGLLGVPLTGPRLLVGLLLFRFFDIVKPLGIRSMEKLPGGYGVMLDDVLAGVYTLILMHLALWLRWL